MGGKINCTITGGIFLMKKINIYGTRESALVFLLANKDRIKVNKFIDGQISTEKMVDISYFDHIEQYVAIPVLKAINDLKQYYTVVATSVRTYWVIKKVLEKLGFEEFVHFEYCATFNKKIALVYGNCNAHGVASILSFSKIFNEKYGFYPVQPTFELYREGIPVVSQYSNKVLKKAALFLYQDVRLNNQYGAEFSSSSLLNKVSCSCRKICIPNFVKLPKFLFPQSQYIDAHIALLKCASQKDIISPFSSRDYFIDRYHERRKLCSLVNMICKDDVIDHNLIKDLFDLFIEKLSKRDKIWDVKTKNFILKNYKNHQLFYDLGHPSRYLLTYVSEEVLKILHMQDCCDLLEDSSIPVYRSFFSSSGRFVDLDYEEVPIYNSVFKSLNLEFSRKLMHQSYVKSEPFHSLSGVRTVEDYVRDYMMFNYGKIIN